MKSIISMFLVFIFTISNAQETNKYRITTIDSTSKHYLIKVERMDDGKIFKGMILSKKTKCKKKKFKDKNKIQLHDILVLSIEPYRYFPSSYNEFNEFSIDNWEVVWRKGDDFFLYETADLKGLYYIPANE